MLTIEELKSLVKKTIESANCKKCVVGLGITVDDIICISHDDMTSIEEDYNIIFACIGNQVLIKIVEM